jgi:hypothetical protein
MALRGLGGGGVGPGEPVQKGETSGVAEAVATGVS